MGEMADYLINGDDCSWCGIHIGDGPGHARLCKDCRKEATPEELKDSGFQL